MPSVTRDEIAVEGGRLPITVAAGPEPHLLVVPSIFGITDDLVEQLQELSNVATVVAMDPFWRVEPGPIAYTKVEKAFTRVRALEYEKSFTDFVALAGWARKRGGPVIGLGICFGGPFCLLAAADGLLDGVVTWHGSRMHQFLQRASEMRCPMKHHFGDADSIVPQETVEQIRSAFEGRDDVEIVVHPGAGHGFSHRAGAGRQEAAERAAMDAVRTLIAEL